MIKSDIWGIISVYIGKILTNIFKRFCAIFCMLDVKYVTFTGTGSWTFVTGFRLRLYKSNRNQLSGLPSLPLSVRSFVCVLSICLYVNIFVFGSFRNWCNFRQHFCFWTLTRKHFVQSNSNLTGRYITIIAKLLSKLV